MFSQNMANGWMAGKQEGRELKDMTGALYNLVWEIYTCIVMTSSLVIARE